MEEKYDRDTDNAAGYMFITDDSKIFLIQRAGYESKWGIPGGHIKEGETPAQGAHRETIEEIGGMIPSRGLDVIETPIPGRDGTYTTFVMSVREEDAQEFQPRLSDEHQDHGWFPIWNPPRWMDEGLKHTLNRLRKTRDVETFQSIARWMGGEPV